jgi:hypothetical protein
MKRSIRASHGPRMIPAIQEIAAPWGHPLRGKRLPFREASLVSQIPLPQLRNEFAADEIDGVEGILVRQISDAHL